MYTKQIKAVEKEVCMRRKGPIDIICLLLLLLIVCIPCYTLSKFLLPNDSKDETKSLRHQVEELQKENAEGKKQKEVKVSNLEEQLATSEEKVSDLEEQLATSEEEVKKLSKQLEEAASIEGNLSTEDKEHLDLLYPYMDFDYEIRDPCIEFYSNPSCEEKFLIKKKLIWVGFVDHAFPYFHSDGTYTTYYSSKVFDYDNDGKDDYVYSKKSPMLYAVRN